MPAVHWSVIGLADIGQHCLTSRVAYWTGLSGGQAGQSIHPIFSLGVTLSDVRIFG